MNLFSVISTGVINNYKLIKQKTMGDYKWEVCVIVHHSNT